MKIISHVIPYKSRGAVFTIYTLSDLHMGSKSFAKERFLRDREEIIHNPFALVTLTGDACEYIHHTDKRFSSEDVADHVLLNLDSIGEHLQDEMVKLLKPIKDKIICMTKGNHELKYEQRFNQKTTENICKELKIPHVYGGWTCMTKLIFKRSKGPVPQTTSFIIHAQHGYSAARTDSGLLSVLNKIPARWDADIFLCGHAHRKMARIIPRVGLSNTTPPRLIDRPIVICCCGSYKKGYQENTITYTERGGYDPTEIGCVKIHIKPDTRAITVEES